MDFLLKKVFDMINFTQNELINRPFGLYGKLYVYDSTTIDLYLICLSLFRWAYFRKSKGGIKVHMLFDIVPHILTYIHITAKNITMLCKQHWQVELFSRWIKQQFRIADFFLNSDTIDAIDENTVQLEFTFEY